MRRALERRLETTPMALGHNSSSMKCFNQDSMRVYFLKHDHHNQRRISGEGPIKSSCLCIRSFF